MQSKTVPEHITALMLEHSLQSEFPDEVTAQADALAADPGIDDPSLDDLRWMPFCTIDEVHSRDLDQALYLEQKGDHLVAYYAIADAAHFVPLRSALFAEALRRGATVYMAGHVVPMLPKILSEGVISLNPHVDRRAVVWRMEVGADGRCVSATVRPARIRSRAKLAYDGVQAWFDGGPQPCSDPGVLGSLELLREFGLRRLTVAEEQGLVRYRRRELEVGTDAAGLRFVAHGDDRNDVERYNEQLSLLCNVQGALALAQHPDPDRLLQPIYRVHEPPETQLMARMSDQLTELVRLRGLDAEQWSWSPDSGRSLAAFLDGLPREGAGRRRAMAIHRQAVLMNRAASYRADPGPHYGVGAPVYGRFSAPMREIVGVFLHQELAEMRAAQAAALPDGFDTPEAVRDAVVQAAGRSRSLQRVVDRTLNRLALDHLFERASGPLPATVMGVTKGRVHLQLDQPPIDAKVYFHHVRDRTGPLRAGPLGLAALQEDGTPWVAVGDAVQVVVMGRDAERDRWALDLHVGG
ncbi:MAG: RNB domain-containing ribonuclease [Myxococcales bacterium]|nr:RNB domain-containing ribonuclease [Myxococcales bacterium]